MTVLLLGGTGFLGSYLRTSLSMISELNFTFANQSIDGGIPYLVGKNELNNISSNKYDVVINNINPINLSYQQTINEIESVVNYCKTNKSKLIQISSVSALQQNRFSNSYNLKKGIVDDFIQTEMSIEDYAIVRYTQMFDFEGLSRKSQAGLYYLLKEIKNNNPISIFSNNKACMRNYLPVELAVNAIEVIIKNNLYGIFNAHFDKFTLSFDELIKLLVSLNPNYNKSLITIGDKVGLPYFIEKQSEELISRMKTPEELESYFKKAYQFINE